VTESEAVQKVVSGEAWREFCHLMAEAGEAVMAEGNPDDPLDRAEGFRMLTRLMRGALESNLEWNDPLHPKLICVCHETIKIVAENPDNLYLGSSIDGAHDYRIHGTRGEARWISFNTFGGGGFGSGGRGTGTTLHEEQLEVAPDGTFEVVLSQREHAGNWLRLEPDSRSVTIRQTFTDKANQQPADLTLERLDADASPPPPLDPEHLVRALQITGHYVRAVTDIGASWARRQAEFPNVFADAQDEYTAKFADPQITYHQAYFDLAPDEALVVDLQPPECDYWMIALHNHWMETLDYRYHRITLNNGSAAAGPDGSVRCVVAHRDPGVPNWLDTAGHQRGTVGVRWVGHEVEDSQPVATLVPLGELAAEVSPDGA